MKLVPLGDSAYILRDLARPAHEVAAALNVARPSGLLEAVASYDTVGLYVDAGSLSIEDVEQALASKAPGGRGKRHEIPVCYELGEDLEEAASALRLSPEELIRHHTGGAYRCFAVGFCPGFAYLGYLPTEIAGLPRRAAPRVRVEPGSVAITGRQTGVYPMPRPGGWHLIGRTPLVLVDVDAEYFPVEAGDEVRFVAIDREEFMARQGERL